MTTDETKALAEAIVDALVTRLVAPPASAPPVTAEPEGGSMTNLNFDCRSDGCLFAATKTGMRTQSGRCFCLERQPVIDCIVVAWSRVVPHSLLTEAEALALELGVSVEMVEKWLRRSRVLRDALEAAGFPR